MVWLVLDDGGAGGPARGLLPPELPRGGLLLEVPAGDWPAKPRLLLGGDGAGEETAGIALHAHADGALELTHRGAAQRCRLRLPEALAPGGEGVRLAYGWDAAARRAELRATRLEDGAETLAEGADPPPLRAAEAEALVAGRAHWTGDRRLAWFALAAAPPPAGRTTGVAAGTPVLTPAGPRPAGALRAGDRVLTADGGASPLSRALVRELPMLGGLAPVRLRAPFFGRERDVLVAPNQRLALRGPDVEYLFGEEEVLIEARWLVDGNTALREARPSVLRIVTLALARPGLILAGGLALEAAGPGAAPRPVLRRHEAAALVALREPGRFRRRL